jgi:hypothetical protein
MFLQIRYLCNVNPQAGIPSECPIAHITMVSFINTRTVIPWTTYEYDCKPCTITALCNTSNSTVLNEWWCGFMLPAPSSVPLLPHLPAKLATLAHTFPPFATAAFISWKLSHFTNIPIDYLSFQASLWCLESKSTPHESQNLWWLWSCWGWLLTWYDIFHCNWVATRWQLFSTHIHTNNTGNVT